MENPNSIDFKKNDQDQNGHSPTEVEQIILYDAQMASEASPALKPENASSELADTLSLTVAADPEGYSQLADICKPDVWSYATVAVFLFFAGISLWSTAMSMHLLVTMLSGGSGIVSITVFGQTMTIADALAAMGAGILDAASFSDAYLDEYKKILSANKKRMSQAGRFFAFIAQASLYYMTLGSLLFQPAIELSPTGQTLDETDATPPSLVLEPPTLLHGVFAGAVSIAWSFGTTYLGPTALLMSIAALRRRPSSKDQTESEPEPQLDPQPESDPQPEPDNQQRLEAFKVMLEHIKQLMKQAHVQQICDVREEERTKQLEMILADINSKFAALQVEVTSRPSSDQAELDFDRRYEAVLDQAEGLIQALPGFTSEEKAELFKTGSRSQSASVTPEPAAPLPSNWFNRFRPIQ